LSALKGSNSKIGIDYLVKSGSPQYFRISALTASRSATAASQSSPCGAMGGQTRTIGQPILFKPKPASTCWGRLRLEQLFNLLIFFFTESKFLFTITIYQAI
jgi:hypothetical protein